MGGHARGGARARQASRRRGAGDAEADATHVRVSARRVRGGVARGEAAEDDDGDLARLSQRPEAFERYAGERIAAGLSPKTVRNHLTLLGLIFRQARKWRWVSEFPLELVDKP